MGPLVMAWLIGEGIVCYRWAKAGAPPTPGALVASSGFFVLCALLAEYAPARGAATLLAFGIDVAALLQVLPGSSVQANTGWPPELIADPSVVLPPGSTGNAAGTGTGGASSSAGGSSNNQLGEGSSGGCPPGQYMIGGKCTPFAAA